MRCRNRSWSAPLPAAILLAAALAFAPSPSSAQPATPTPTPRRCLSQSAGRRAGRRRRHPIRGRRHPAALKASIRPYPSTGRPAPGPTRPARSWASVDPHAARQPRGCADAYEAALALWRGLGERQMVGRTLNSLGWSHFRLGQTAEAKASFSEALAISAAARAGRGASGVGGLAGVHYTLGEYADAIARYSEALAIARELGDLPMSSCCSRRLARPTTP